MKICWKHSERWKKVSCMWKWNIQKDFQVFSWWQTSLPRTFQPIVQCIFFFFHVTVIGDHVNLPEVSFFFLSRRISFPWWQWKSLLIKREIIGNVEFNRKSTNTFILEIFMTQHFHFIDSFWIVSTLMKPQIQLSILISHGTYVSKLTKFIDSFHVNIYKYKYVHVAHPHILISENFNYCTFLFVFLEMITWYTYFIKINCDWGDSVSGWINVKENIFSGHVSLNNDSVLSSHHSYQWRILLSRLSCQRVISPDTQPYWVTKLINLQIYLLEKLGTKVFLPEKKLNFRP